MAELDPYILTESQVRVAHAFLAGTSTGNVLGAMLDRVAQGMPPSPVPGIAHEEVIEPEEGFKFPVPAEERTGLLFGFNLALGYSGPYEEQQLPSDGRRIKELDTKSIQILARNALGRIRERDLPPLVRTWVNSGRLILED